MSWFLANKSFIPLVHLKKKKNNCSVVEFSSFHLWPDIMRDFYVISYFVFSVLYFSIKKKNPDYC